MKRDVDLSRLLLLYVEKHSPPQGGLDNELEIEGYDRPTVLAHAELLIEDGLLDGRAVKSLVGLEDVHVLKLTARGHDAIAAARDNTAWNKAKRYAVERGIPLTIGAVVEVIKTEIRKYIRSRRGVRRQRPRRLGFIGESGASARARYPP